MSFQVDGHKTKVYDLESSIQEKDQTQITLQQRISELEQNVSVWQTAANDKEGTEGKMMEKIQEQEKQSQTQRETLQNQVIQLETQLRDVKNDQEQLQTSSDAMKKDLDNKVSELTTFEERCNEMQTIMQQQELAYDNLCKEYDTNTTDKKNYKEATDKEIAELKEDIEGLRGDRHNLEQRLEKLHQQSEGTVDAYVLESAKETIERLKTEAREKIEKLREQISSVKEKLVEKTMELSDLKLDSEAEIKNLKFQLEEERLHMNTFKENVKKQFDNRQEMTKETINLLKTRYEGVIKDKEDIQQKKVEKLTAEFKQGKYIFNQSREKIFS